MAKQKQMQRPPWYFFSSDEIPGLEIAADTVANVTNIFSLATKNSGLVATLATRYFSMS